MSLFGSMVRKEFRHILRDPWTLAILLLLPLLMLILFGYALTTEVRGARLCIVDLSRDGGTREIARELEALESFSRTVYQEDPRELERLFRKNLIDLAVVFPEGFLAGLTREGGAAVQILADGTDPNKAVSLVSYATGVVTSWQLRNSSGTAGYSILPEVRLLYNPSMKGAYNFVPGVMGMILMLICSMMTSISIAREKERGTMEILLVSPMKPLWVILAKTVPYFAVSLLNLTTILAFSTGVLGVPVRGNPVLLIFISLLYILVNLGLGLLVSSAVKTQQVALLISGMAMMIPVILLSGMLFPLENLPWFLRLLSRLIPARWYIQAVREIMIKGTPFSGVIRETLILGGMALAFLLLSLKQFKTRLE